ncbi:MAG TPA: zf-HC2 domain-containing protein [Acidobacteriota bacterium]|nr:zf-HC2 domain-containing protein [Acidobacteriota bacterium]
MKTTECHSLSESLTAYLDGELSDAERAEFEAALKGNASLSEDLRSHQRARQIIDEALQPLPLSTDLWNGIRREISSGFEKRPQGAGRASSSGSWLWRWAPLTAAAVIVLVVALSFPLMETAPLESSVDPQVERQYLDFVRSRQQQEQQLRGQPRWTDVEDNPFRRTSFNDLNRNPFAGE